MALSERSRIVVAEWETFYVIIGSSAAALTGLQFVVIALGADTRAIGNTQVIDAFATPTVVHFCMVLLIGATLSVPRQTTASLAVCLSLLGAAGLVYSLLVAARARRQTGYEAVLEDWIFHVGLPHVAYAALLIAGLCAYVHQQGALYFVALIALLLLL